MSRSARLREAERQATIKISTRAGRMTAQGFTTTVLDTTRLHCKGSSVKIQLGSRVVTIFIRTLTITQIALLIRLASSREIHLTKEGMRLALVAGGHQEQLRGKTTVGGNLTMDDMLPKNQPDRKRQTYRKDRVRMMPGLANPLIFE